MNRDEKLFDFLMSEKEFADKQIGAALENHLKILGFLAAAVVLLGWLYSDKASTSAVQRLPLIVVIMVVLGCAVILQAIVFYGSSLAYTEHKRLRLAPAFAELLGHDLALAGDDWRESAARTPVNIALVTLFAMHAAVSVGLLCVAWPPTDRHLQMVFVGAFVLIGITITCEVMVGRAVKRIVFPNAQGVIADGAESTSPGATA